MRAGRQVSSSSLSSSLSSSSSAAAAAAGGVEAQAPAREEGQSWNVTGGANSGSSSRGKANGRGRYSLQ